MNNLQHTVRIIVSESGLTSDDFLRQGLHLISNQGIYSYGIKLSGLFNLYDA